MTSVCTMAPISQDLLAKNPSSCSKYSRSSTENKKNRYEPREQGSSVSKAKFRRLQEVLPTVRTAELDCSGIEE